LSGSVKAAAPLRPYCFAHCKKLASLDGAIRLPDGCKVRFRSGPLRVRATNVVGMQHPATTSCPQGQNAQKGGSCLSFSLPAKVAAPQIGRANWLQSIVADASRPSKSD